MRVCIANPAFIGDVLFSSRMCDALVKSFPNVEILFVAKPPAHQLAQFFPGVSSVVSFDKRGQHKGWGGVRAMAKQITEFSPDIFITTHRGWRMALLARLLGPKVRKVGFKGFWRFLFDEVAPYRKGDSFFAKEAQLLAVLGISETTARMRCGSQWIRGEKNVILAPGANWATKRWPLASFIGLAKAFIDDDWQVALTGGPDEMDLCTEIKNAVPACENNCGESLESAMKQMQTASLVVANDSGLAHLSRAVGTPTLIVFGPTPSRVHDLNAEKNTQAIAAAAECAPCSTHGHDNCPQGHHKCMADLAVKDVFQAARELVVIDKS